MYSSPRYRSIASIGRELLRTKDIGQMLHQQSDTNGNQFDRTLTALDLTVVGIGAIVGTGIFVLTGTAAALYAGPAVVISFAVAGLVAGLAAFCYSEMASMIPLSGSAYSYSYATMGELTAWIIGWDLILEYVVGAAAVAVGWSGYMVSLFEDGFRVRVDPKWTQPPLKLDVATQQIVSSGAILNLPAFVACLFITAVLLLGIKKASIVNNMAVAVKLAVIAVFVCAAIPHVDSDNWKPFVPPNTGRYGEFGPSGVLQAASVVFFAFIGFDAISTTAQECKNPQRDIPIGIISSLVICTGLYIVVAFLLTGLVPYTELNVSHPLSFAVQKTVGGWMAIFVEVGAVAGLSSVLLVSLMGQPRIFFAMANDGLLPKVFARLDLVHQTPWLATVVSGLACAFLAAIFPIDILSELTSIGTLFAFFLVSVGVIILRKRRPSFPRKFTIPGGPWGIPLLSAICNFALIFSANSTSIIRLAVWMLIGVIIYIFYGYRNSVLRRGGAGLRKESDSSEYLPDAIDDGRYVQMDNFDFEDVALASPSE